MDRWLSWLDVHRWMALTLAVLGFCGYLFVAVLLPKAVDARTHLEVWKKHQARIAALSDGEAEQSRLGDRTRSLQQRFAALYVGLPGEDRMSGLIQMLQENADRARVALLVIRPGERKTHAVYDEWPISIRLRGSFHRLLAFIHYIEHAPHLLKVRQLTIERTGASSPMLRAEAALTAFILRRQGERE